MVTHAVDVLSAGDIGFAGHQATITILTHAKRVGQFHPFHRIHIHRQIPCVYLFGVHTEQKRIQAGDHQPLNMVRIAVHQCLTDGVTQASHVGVAGPKKAW